MISIRKPLVNNTIKDYAITLISRLGVSLIFLNKVDCYIRSYNSTRNTTVRNTDNLDTSSNNMDVRRFNFLIVFLNSLIRISRTILNLIININFNLNRIISRSRTIKTQTIEGYLYRPDFRLPPLYFKINRL